VEPLNHPQLPKKTSIFNYQSVKNGTIKLEYKSNQSANIHISQIESKRGEAE
jgi:hypothetical protein